MHVLRHARRLAISGAEKPGTLSTRNDTTAGSGFRRVLARLLSEQDGGPLVEFAMVLPWMLLTLTGIFYLGVALTLYLQLTNATDIGARQLSISRGQTSDPCSTAATAIEAAAPNLSTSSLSFSYTIDGQAYTGTTCTAGAPYMIQGKSAVVQASYPVHLGIFLLGWSTVTLKAQTTELIQ